MNIIVTGGAGFIGGEIVRQLAKRKDVERIFVLDKISPQSQKEQIEGVSEKILLFKMDISKKETWAFNNVDCVINCAAETHVDRSITSVYPFIDSNMVGTSRALEFCRNRGIKMLQVSTDEVYGSIKEGSATEDYPRKAKNPYAATKMAAEALCESSYSTYQSKVVITRGSNTYGPWQYEEKLIPTIIKKALENEPIPIYGDGSNIRQWLSVKDHAKGIIKVLFEGLPGEVYNIGGDFTCNNLVIVKKILNILGKPESLISFVEDRKGHDWRYSINTDKIKNELGWCNEVDFDWGLLETVKWFSDCKN